MSQSQGEQRCYLHPDRLARISCQRCGRPICPADMRDASVGFQCPPCVSMGAKAQRQPKTVFGGRISANPRSVTTSLIIVNIVIFVAMMATGGSRGSIYQEGAMWAFGVANGEYWRMLSSAFLHSGIMHIAFNMLALYLFGPAIEEALGRARFLTTYITLAVAASVWVYWLAPLNTSTVGASGAVFGLFGVILVFMLRAKQDVTGLLVLLGINAVISLQANISWQAHLGGFLTGVVLAVVFVKAPRDRQQLVHMLAFAGLWLLIIAASALRTAQLWSQFT